MSNFDYRQFEKWAKELEKTASKFEDEFLKPFLLQMAMRAVADIKKRTPVGRPEEGGTGALRASWGIGTADRIERTVRQKYEDIPYESATVGSITVNGSNLEVEIWNGMYYATFVEYGTRNMDGFFMMTVGLDEIKKQIEPRFQKEFNAWLSKQGV